MNPKIKGPSLIPRGIIQPPKIEPDQEKVVFSFTYFDPSDSEINCLGSEKDYFHKLLERFKAVGQVTVRYFKTNCATNYGALRAHPINWNHPKNIKKGFGIPQRNDLDDLGWQFSVSRATNGRVHGFLIDRVFHVVWLDPEHKLYPWD